MRRCAGLQSRPVGLGGDDFNNINNVNANDNFNNNGFARGIVHQENGRSGLMKTYHHLFQKLCSIKNLEDAYWKARKRKSNNPKVKEFEKHAQLHLAVLHRELWTKTYTPRLLKKFILRDPKTRTICVSDFRDRIVHHALINILQPIFEPRFIHDSYASRKGKGTLAAIKRFEKFSRKTTKNWLREGFALKADIRHYFDRVNHKTLLDSIAKRVHDEDVLWLTRTILLNSSEDTGMPLGNWTSQFFANVYLNELDQFVKNELKAKYYIRYVDDIVILHHLKEMLEIFREKIIVFIKSLHLELHPTKCSIIQLSRGANFLGYRIFPKHKLLRQRNIRKIYQKLELSLEDYSAGETEFNSIFDKLQGWNGYAKHANTHKLGEKLFRYVQEELSQRQNRIDSG